MGDDPFASWLVRSRWFSTNVDALMAARGSQFERHQCGNAATVVVRQSLVQYAKGESGRRTVIILHKAGETK